MPAPELSPLMGRLLDAGLGSNPAAEAPPPSAPPEPPRKRPKLWDLADKYHCPVIGTCIPLNELQNIARRFSFAASLRDEYALHSEAVGWSRSRNEVSEALQRLLDRKFETWVERFDKLKTDEAVHRQWKECLSRGEVAGPLWAVFSHRASEAETRQAAFADIHMLSHQVGAGQAADSQRLAHLEKENAELKKAAVAERREADRQLQALRLQLATLQAQVADEESLQDEIATLRRRLQQFESGQAMVEMGQRLLALQNANDHLRAAAQRVWDLDQALQASREEARRSARERDRLAGERDALERLLLAAAPEAERDCRSDCNACEKSSSLQCILYVGGRTAMVHHYRALAERLGIRLLHHDGGLEESVSRLPEMIQGADAVICPTDCVSHTAYYQLKSHCKRNGKPCLFFKGAGVSSFATAVAKLANGRFSLAGSVPALPE